MLVYFPNKIICKILLNWNTIMAAMPSIPFVYTVNFMRTGKNVYSLQFAVYFVRFSSAHNWTNHWSALEPEYSRYGRTPRSSHLSRIYLTRRGVFCSCHLDTADFEEFPLDAVASLPCVAKLSCEKPLCADSILDIDPLQRFLYEYIMFQCTLCCDD